MNTADDIICHAPGDRCHGCDHYHGKAPECKYKGGGGGVSLNPKDLIIKSWPPKPRKGMQTGKIPAGVEITHKPTGERVIINYYRHQHQNRELALKELAERLGETP